MLQPLVAGVEIMLPKSDPVVQIALFHTIFNLIDILTRGLQKLFTKEKEYVTEYIHNVSVDIPEVACEALNKEIRHLAQEVENFALLAINIPPAKALKGSASVEKLLDSYQENFDVTYDRLYTRIGLLEGEILRFITNLATTGNDADFQGKLHQRARQITYMATGAKAIKDMLHDIDLLFDSQTREESVFLRNLRYQILQSVQVFDKALTGEKDAYREMDDIYHKISKSYQNSMELISDMAKNSMVSSKMLTIVVNDMHLSKSFSKSLRNTLLIFLEKHEGDNPENTGL